MKNKNFNLSTTVVWLLMVCQLLLIWAGAWIKIQGGTSSGSILISGITLFLVTYIIIFIDILRQPLHNKTFWWMSMILLPGIAGIFYLIQRHKLLTDLQTSFIDKGRKTPLS
jgi:hypothetical protein